MKTILLVLIFAASLQGAPAELAFLESLLPDSEHLYTHTIKSAPSGVIIAQYRGKDSMETVILCLNKALGVKFVEIPVSDKKRDLLYTLWEASRSNPADTHKRIQAEGITIDIGISHWLDDATGISTRRISLYIIRKGA